MVGDAETTRTDIWRRRWNTTSTKTPWRGEHSKQQRGVGGGRKGESEALKKVEETRVTIDPPGGHREQFFILNLTEILSGWLFFYSHCCFSNVSRPCVSILWIDSLWYCLSRAISRTRQNPKENSFSIRATKEC